jgi:uncharacterized repeat protein (TIGR03803 family)
LYAFTGGADGANPAAYAAAGVIRDSAGNLYGTTRDGGTGYGVVFKLDTAGQETVLHSFTGGIDGAYPVGGVIRDSAGNLYGTAAAGGTAGAGVVFKVNKAGKQTVLYAFRGGDDGGNPDAGVIRDSAGNLYGTTQTYGAENVGVVYKLNKAGKEKVLYSFTCSGGCYPDAGVIRDSAGNLYGTTTLGGGGSGVVFKLDTTGQETVLYSFTGGADGSIPYGGLISDPAGNLYGTTYYGGAANAGAVYKLTPQ